MPPPAGQTQPQAAADLGVLRVVYDRWKSEGTELPVGFWKQVLALLRYYPMP